MSANDERTQLTQGPSEFFGAIGDKVSNLTPVQNGAQDLDGDADEQRAVEEIESLCMNCRENVGHRKASCILTHD